MYVKTNVFFFTSLLLLSACSTDNGIDWSEGTGTSPNGNQGGSNFGPGGNTSTATGSFSDATFSQSSGNIIDLTTFDIALDRTALAGETDPGDEGLSKTVTITFANGSVSHSDLDGVTFQQSGAHLIAQSTKKVNFILTGQSSEGSFKLYSENKCQLTLQDLTLTNPNGAALNIQTRKGCTLYCPAGSSSILTDGTEYVGQVSSSTLAEPLVALGEAEDQKGVIFSEGQLFVGGTGSLTVNALGKNGIATDQYLVVQPGANLYVNVASSASNGIKADEVRIEGGVINVENAADGGKGITSQGRVTISGGRTTLITTGSAVQQTEGTTTTVSGPCGLKADSLFTITGGTLLCKSTGSGGKGISTDMDCHIEGGAVWCITTGTTFGQSSSAGGMGGRPGGWGGSSSSSSSSTSSKPKAIKVDGNLTISGGSVKVRCCASTTSGNDGHEGIESKGTITISGGEVASFSYDDAVNSAKQFTISGGKIFAYSINNDGLDANAAMTISGGCVIAIGTQAPELGIDTVEGTVCTITGGTMLSFSSTTMTQSFRASNGSCSATTCSVSGGQVITLDGGSKKAYFIAPRAIQGRFQYYLQDCSSVSLSTSESLPTLSSGAAPFYNFAVQ